MNNLLRIFGVALSVVLAVSAPAMAQLSVSDIGGDYVNSTATIATACGAVILAGLGLFVAFKLFGLFTRWVTRAMHSR